MRETLKKGQKNPQTSQNLCTNFLLVFPIPPSKKVSKITQKIVTPSVAAGCLKKQCFFGFLANRCQDFSEGSKKVPQKKFLPVCCLRFHEMSFCLFSQRKHQKKRQKHEKVKRWQQTCRREKRIREVDLRHPSHGFTISQNPKTESELRTEGLQKNTKKTRKKKVDSLRLCCTNSTVFDPFLGGLKIERFDKMKDFIKKTPPPDEIQTFCQKK